MKKKSIVIILILAMLLLATGSAYPGGRPPGGTFGSPAKGHPWEEPNDNNGPYPSSAWIMRHDHRVIIIPIFSDFMIWIFVGDIRNGSDQQKNSIKIEEGSYQIIFPW